MRTHLAVSPALLLLCAALLLSACAAPALKKDILRPAKASEVARLTRLTVKPFEGDHDGRVRAAVESTLASIQVNGRPYFTLIGEGAPPAQSLGTPMQWGSKGKGPRYGSEGLVQGVVGSHGWRDDYYIEQRRECIMDDGKGRCQLWGNRNLRCTKRRATFAFTPRVTARDTGEVLMSQEFSQTEESSGCPDQNGPIGGQALLSRAEDKVMERFRKHVAPHVDTLQIPLVIEDGSAMDPAIKLTLEKGLELAKDGHAGEACRHFRAAAAQHKTGYATAYLQGACEEYEGDLDAAEGFYRQAQARAGMPVDVVDEGFARLRQARADRDKLDNQLR